PPRRSSDLSRLHRAPAEVFCHWCSFARIRRTWCRQPEYRPQSTPGRCSGGCTPAELCSNCRIWHHRKFSSALPTVPHRSTRCKLQSGTNYNNVLIDTEAGLQPLSPVRPAGIEISDVSCNNIELRKLFSNRFRSLSNDPVFIAITDSEHFAENLLHNAHHHALLAWMALLASAISCWLNT